MTADVAEALTGTEARRLRVCEQTIERGLAEFVEVGEALAEVRDSRLYRESFTTFEAYCRDRWNLSHANAGRYIREAAASRAVSPIGLTANEAQARELAPLLSHPAALRQVAKRATLETEDGTLPTAAKIREIAQPVIEKLRDRAPSAADLAEQERFEAGLAKPTDPEGDKRRQRAAMRALGIINACDALRAEFTVGEWKRDGVSYIRRFTPDVGERLVAAAALVASIAHPFEEK